ncbi:hypothetical protein J4Q44_G00124870, partial [Coregonus suidteri]
DDHGGDPYHGGYDLGYGGGGGPSYAPPQPWGHPDLHLMQPHHGIPIQARLGNIHDMDLGLPPPVIKRALRSSFCPWMTLWMRPRQSNVIMSTR